MNFSRSCEAVLACLSIDQRLSLFFSFSLKKKKKEQKQTKPHTEQTEPIQDSTGFQNEWKFQY